MNQDAAVRRVRHKEHHRLVAGFPQALECGNADFHQVERSLPGPRKLQDFMPQPVPAWFAEPAQETLLLERAQHAIQRRAGQLQALLKFGDPHDGGIDERQNDVDCAVDRANGFGGHLRSVVSG